MTINSRDKGKRGELNAAKFLRSLGFDARRTQQYDGKGLSDITIENRPQLHIEVKFGYPAMHCSSKLLQDAIDQAVRDCGGCREPMVMWKAKGQRDWKLTFRSSEGMWCTVWHKMAITHVLRNT